MSLAGKKIVLGVSGGIAAYKTPELVRRLRDRGADVRVAMTEAAKAFITPLSLQAVSGYPVSDSLLDPAAEAAMGHIELGKWADLVILAPATADLIARVAAGMANDLVSTICLATPAPVAVLPAMNQQMYRAAATQHNLEVLASRGLLIWGPDSGSQACGDIGPGRMLDPLTIVDMAVAHFSPVNDLKHLNIMITAGPTREPLDPVRYISNHSSGKMGFAIAAAAARRGANVTLVSGPVSLPTPPFVKRVDVMTALEMEAAVNASVQQQNIFIGCAAVADYRAALMEELAVDDRLGYFVNHDMAGYEVPVHADIPKQEVIFLDDTDPISSPMKAKGVGELGLCGVSAAIANAVYNATGIRVRDYPITLDKLLDKLPDVV
ncbi:bifunctional phosphopantothenoylcysteine decarboxylase/phosphopantothenate synthase [Escherichia coli O157:H7 str. K2191]|nr:bifunctional phosphopantothenoylcysteine decarboxylase/phosphopantothenate synthase [Escherichia coli O157:H7 str. K2191]